MKESLERFFRLQEKGTSIKVEFLAGVTTFLAMAYILAVNPSILSLTGMDKGGVFIATALAAVVGTLLMGLGANLPCALAPGMGLNAYFTFTVVKKMGYSWQIALFAIFVEGFIFLLLSVTPVRKAIFNAIPMPLKKAVSVGIGLFIAFIALQSAHIIIGDGATLLKLQQFNYKSELIHQHGVCAILAAVGFLITAILMHKKVRGGILLGIFITWGLGMLAQWSGLYIVSADPNLKCFSLYPTISFSTLRDTFMGFYGLCGQVFNVKAWSLQGTDVTGFALLKSFNFVVIMFAFLFVDLFDTLGVLVGVCSKGKMLNEKGELPELNRALLADSIATSAGAIFGTSTTTTYVESTAGVAEGGRSGLTAVVTALLFFVAILFAPIFLAIPGFATAPALIIVGLYMMEPITEIDFSNLCESVPCYITILAMPFAYSIAEGISLGIISWTILNLVCRTGKNTNLLYVLTILFLARYAVL